MKRRRGEISLFEILRQPEAAPEPPPKAEKAPPKAKKTPKRAKSPAKKSARAALIDIEGDEGHDPNGIDPAHGSTTPSRDPAPRPRIDVTPPARVRRRLPELAEELATPPAGPVEKSGPEWWERDLVIRPVVVGIAGVGVLLSWLVAYLLGAGSAEDALARRDLFSGTDAPGWELPVVHGAPGRQPEVRSILGQDGEPAERLPPETVTGNVLLPVVMVAQKVGKPENADSLIAHIGEHFEAGLAYVTPFRGDYAVFIGPFDTPEEAKEAMKRIRALPKHKGTEFRDAYVHQLEFTPEELQGLSRD